LLVFVGFSKDSPNTHRLSQIPNTQSTIDAPHPIVTEDLRKFMSKENLEKEIDTLKKVTKIKKIATSTSTSNANNNYSSILNVSDLKGKNYVLYDQNVAKKPPPPPLVSKKAVPSLPPSMTTTSSSSSSSSKATAGQQISSQQGGAGNPSFTIKEKRVSNQVNEKKQATRAPAPPASILNPNVMPSHHASNGSINGNSKLDVNDLIYYDYANHQYMQGDHSMLQFIPKHAEFEPVHPMNKKTPQKMHIQQPHHHQNNEHHHHHHNHQQHGDMAKNSVITNLGHLIAPNHPILNGDQLKRHI
jgi:hypothetical protein